MAAAKTGDTVRVHYKGTLDDGSVFDSSEGREPLEFTLGEGQVVPGFEELVSGMEVGEKRTRTLAAAEAYGDRNDQMMLRVPRDQFPEGLVVEPGEELSMRLPDGQGLNVVVAEVTDDSIVLDANHPLAGQALTFEVELVDLEARS